MAVGDLYQLRVDYTLPDSNVSIGLGFRQKAGTNGPATLRSAVDFFNANRLAAFLDVLSTEVEVDQIRMDLVSPGDEIPGFVNLVGIPGTRIGPPLPAGSAAVLSWITDAPNAKHNGRFYIAGIPEVDVVDGVLIAAILVDLGLLGTDWNQDLLTSLPEDAVFELITISRFVNGGPRILPIGFLVENFVIRVPMYSQRRRITRRLGIN